MKTGKEQLPLNLPLTFRERMGKKSAQIVRASVRIVVLREDGAAPHCLFIPHPEKGLEVPGGAVDPGEQPLVAALRELREEAGLHLDPQRHQVKLAGFIPVATGDAGHWLDAVYCASVPALASAAMATTLSAEFEPLWLSTTGNLRARLSPTAFAVVQCALTSINQAK